MKKQIIRSCVTREALPHVARKGDCFAVLGESKVYMWNGRKWKSVAWNRRDGLFQYAFSNRMSKVYPLLTISRSRYTLNSVIYNGLIAYAGNIYSSSYTRKKRFLDYIVPVSLPSFIFVEEDMSIYCYLARDCGWIGFTKEDKEREETEYNYLICKSFLHLEEKTEEERTGRKIADKKSLGDLYGITEALRRLSEDAPSDNDSSAGSPSQSANKTEAAPGDPVNHPSHYNHGKIEVIDFIDDQGLDFSLGNAIKYICRAKYKGSELKDLEKAVWYINHKISQLKLTKKQN